MSKVARHAKPWSESDLLAWQMRNRVYLSNLLISVEPGAHVRYVGALLHANVLKYRHFPYSWYVSKRTPFRQWTPQNMRQNPDAAVSYEVVSPTYVGQSPAGPWHMPAHVTRVHITWRVE